MKVDIYSAVLLFGAFACAFMGGLHFAVYIIKNRSKDLLNTILWVIVSAMLTGIALRHV